MRRVIKKQSGNLTVSLVLLGVSIFSAGSTGIAQDVHYGFDGMPVCGSPQSGSPYIPVDSWIYPAMMRLYSLGYLDTVYLGMRPWTRASVERMLEETHARITDAFREEKPQTEEALKIYTSVTYALQDKLVGGCLVHQDGPRLESAYTTIRGITGTPLRDSFHLGSTIVNDFGRPFSNGVNNYSGASGFATWQRYTIYLRGEFQGAPSATGYSTSLAQTLTGIDLTTYLNPVTGQPYDQATIPAGPISATTTGRLIEGYIAVHALNTEFSFGKQDDWLGPGIGGGMAYSNNADNIDSFRINRVKPLYIPVLSRLVGPFRYEFLVGSLKGHVYPNSPWMHLEKVSFKPTENLELGFERTVIWGGKGHEPITLHTFLRSFFSTANVTADVKNSAQDPGARFGAFDFSYRLPLLRNWVTIYTDSEAHDDVSPISAPRRAAFRPGLYLSHVPGLPQLDVRVEGVSTDPPTSRSNGGQFNYYETVQRQGYTNKGSIFGDWMGREAKGGQAWITYHLSGNEWLQASYRHQKTAKDFIPGGTTLNDFSFQAVKRIGKDIEVNARFAYEQWKAPIYLPGTQTVTTTTVRVTWFPERKIEF